MTTCVAPGARARRLLSSALLVLALGGCVTGPTPRPAPFSDEVRRLVALLTLRHGQVADLRTLAEVTVRQGAAARRFSGVLLAREPDAIRFEALSPLGQPFLLVAIADGTLTSYHVGDNRVFRGPATAGASGWWLGVRLGPQDLYGLLLGRPVPPRGLREAELLPADADGPSLRLVGDDHTQRVWLDAETGEVSRVEIAGGRRTLTVAYDDFGADGVPAVIQADSTGLQASLRYRDPVVGRGLDPDAFDLRVPEGATIQPLR